MRRPASGVTTAATPKQFLFATGLLLASALSAAIETRSRLETADRPAPSALTSAVAQALAAPIVTVVDKPQPSPTGDNHDYVSYARYYWPDPAKPDGLPFIPKDGHHNLAQVAAGDRGKVDLIVDHVTTLTLGWTQLRREDCARRAGEWLRAWFVTPATRMKPGLDYAQVRLGHNKNRGNATGVLDVRRFVDLTSALTRLHGSPALTAEDEQAVRQWFAEFYRWLQTGDSALKERAARNNHGSWYFYQVAALAGFLGREDEARRWCEEAKALIAGQFLSDGSQPMEIERADGLHYSHFNLFPLMELARQARGLGIDLWNYTAPNGASLKRGFEYLRPYNDAPEKWPHKQHEPVTRGFLDELVALAAELDAPVAKP